MSASNLLRKARPVNLRAARAQLSTLIRSKQLTVFLSNSKPVSYLVSYEDMLDLVEILDELQDKKHLGEIARARKDYAQGKAVSADRLLATL